MPLVQGLGVQRLNYYAHPRNQFWPIVSQVLGLALSEMSFADRYQALLARGLGLWDVIQDCEREGSLDQAIRSAQHAGLSQLSQQAPALKYLLLNGRKAQTEARKALAGNPEHQYVLLDLPSTSPAHAAMTQAHKLTHWQAALGQAGIGPNPLDTTQA